MFFNNKLLYNKKQLTKCIKLEIVFTTTTESPSK